MENKTIILITIVLLFLLAIITVPHDLLDVTDLPDYSDTAKFFAGEYKAKHRSTHSILYGAMLSPYVKLVKGFFIIKFASVFWLSLLILSVYYISNRNRKTLLLFVTLPLIWYIAPWMSPVPLVSLLFLWAFYFINKFDSGNSSKYLIYSGLLMGVASAFWDTALYFSILFLVSFFYNKKLYFSWLFMLTVFIGLIPRLIVDYIVFGFPFYGILKNAGALISFGFYGGAYSQGYSSPNLLGFIMVFLFIPFYFYLFYTKKNFIKNKKVMIFLTLSILFILLNPLPRPIFVIAPIIVLLLGDKLSKKQFRIQILIFLVLSLLVIAPYIAQAKYETNVKRFTIDLPQYLNLEFNSTISDKLIIEDLSDIEKEHPNEVFVIGNDNDYYRRLAHLYWGEGIQEFISIEDYRLFLKGEDTIASKEIRSNAGPMLRREIWLEIGLGKNSNDRTDYDSIRYGISFDKNLDLDNFRLKREYRILNLFEKIK